MCFTHVPQRRLYMVVNCTALATVIPEKDAQVVSRQPFTAEDQLQTQSSPRGIYGGQSDTGIGFSPSSSVFLRLIAQMLHIHLFDI